MADTPAAVRTPEFCSVCGEPLADWLQSDAYPNPVCEDCTTRAVTERGRPVDSLPGVAANDAASGPVSIDGCRCWQEETADGIVAMRDPAWTSGRSGFEAINYTDDGDALQTFVGQDPRGPMELGRRFLCQKVDKRPEDIQEWTTRLYGLVTLDEVLLANPRAVEAFGPLEEQLEVYTRPFHPQPEGYESPTAYDILGHGRDLGSQAQRMSVRYIHPDLATWPSYAERHRVAVMEGLSRVPRAYREVVFVQTDRHRSEWAADERGMVVGVLLPTGATSDGPVDAFLAAALELFQELRVAVGRREGEGERLLGDKLRLEGYRLNERAVSVDIGRESLLATDWTKENRSSLRTIAGVETSQGEG